MPRLPVSSISSLQRKAEWTELGRPSDSTWFTRAFTAEKRVTKVGDDIRAVSDFFGFQPAQFCKLKMADLPIRDIMVLTNNGDKIVQ
ncbi:unnamed protein product [Nippostrongylus brasiliensis]|uniref:MOSC domain-containing protein n=1 Tax=Nippostrongylus brasiliensis TaxID=27835 RepID=A0A0N4Y756_NIPBR|nr:unnamed protein product [Nippostrongylus brasiliensis]